MKLYLQFSVALLLAAWLLFAQECEAKLFSARLMAVGEDTAPTVQLGYPLANCAEADDLGCDTPQCVKTDRTVEGGPEDPIQIPDRGNVSAD